MMIGLALSPCNATLNKGGGGGTKLFRALGQGMSTDLVGYVSANTAGRTAWKRFWSPVPFQRYRIIYAKGFTALASSPTRTLDIVIGSPADTGGAGAAARSVLRVGTAISRDLPTALTGIPEREQLVTFGGANYWTHDYSTFPGSPVGSDYFVASDIMTLASPIPAGPFAIWNTVEGDAAAANLLPCTQYGSSFIDRKEGYINHATSQLAGGATPMMDATNITAWTAVRAGEVSMFTPVAIEIEVAATIPYVTLFGDSTYVRYGEGGVGSEEFGDQAGDINGNVGWPQRKLATQGGVIWNNLSRGGERYNYLIDASPAWVGHSNWLIRAALLKRFHGVGASDMGAGVILAGNGLNDFLNDSISIGTRSNSAAIVKGAARRWTSASVARNYYALNSGTTGASTPLHNSTVVDGTVTWKQVGVADATPDRFMANMESTWAYWRELVPNIKIYAATIMFEATSTDGFSSLANQTPIAGFGDQTSSSGLMNARFRAGETTQDGWLEARTSAIETVFTVDGSGVATESGVVKPGVDYGTRTLTAAPSSATSGTLTTPWDGPTATYAVGFSGGAYRLATLTNGDTAVNAPKGLSQSTQWTTVSGVIASNSVTDASATITVREAPMLWIDGVHNHSKGAAIHAAGLPTWTLPSPAA